MDTLQNLMYPTVDVEGFVDGSLSQFALTPANTYRVVATPLPVQPLPDGQQWRWDGQAWSAQTDIRKQLWYDPDNTSTEHRPQNMTDYPPAGFVLSTDGLTKIVKLTESLPKAQNAKWALLRDFRDQLEASSFPYLGKQIQSDIKSVLRINTAVKAADYAQAMGAPFATLWRCEDDTLLPLDGPAMQFMPVALAAYAQALHTQANELREQVYSATTIAELDAIIWPSL